MKRATMSLDPPGGKVTTMVTARAGQVWAVAVPANRPAATKMDAVIARFMERLLQVGRIGLRPGQ